MPELNARPVGNPTYLLGTGSPGNNPPDPTSFRTMRKRSTCPRSTASEVPMNQPRWAAASRPRADHDRLHWLARRETADIDDDADTIAAISRRSPIRSCRIYPPPTRPPETKKAVCRTQRTGPGRPTSPLTPEQAAYNVLGNFFNGAIAAGHYGGQPFAPPYASPLHFLNMVLRGRSICENESLHAAADNPGQC
jgi:hypothetical protein